MIPTEVEEGAVVEFIREDSTMCGSFGQIEKFNDGKLWRISKNGNMLVLIRIIGTSEYYTWALQNCRMVYDDDPD